MELAALVNFDLKRRKRNVSLERRKAEENCFYCFSYFAEKKEKTRKNVAQKGQTVGFRKEGEAKKQRERKPKRKASEDERDRQKESTPKNDDWVDGFLLPSPQTQRQAQRQPKRNRANANANGTHEPTGKGNMLHAEPGDIAADFARLLVTDVESLQPDSSGISECDTLDTTVLGKVCIMALYLFVASLCLQFCSSCCDQGQDLVACAADGCPIVVCTGEADGTACLKLSEYQGDTWFCPGHNIPFVMKVFSANLMSNVFCILLTPPSSMISCQKILVS